MMIKNCALSINQYVTVYIISALRLEDLEPFEMVCTLALVGQFVGRVPVLVAAQDVVGDVDMAGSHVVDALRDGDAARGRGRGRGGNHGSGVTVDRADRRGTQRHGRWCSCSPDRHKAG